MAHKSLISGGAGFLGSHLCDELIKRGHDVLCVDNFFTGNKDNVSHLISLQKEPFEDKDNTFYKKLIKFDNLDNENPFEDTAAIIDNCELIISCDTSIAHLAGTLGKKTFLMLNYNNDWRWGLDKEYCQWYKNIKIYRQVLPNSWDLPFQKCYEDILKNLPKYEKD